MKQTITRRWLLSGLGSLAATGAALANAPTASLRPVARGADILRRSMGNPVDTISKAKLSGTVSFAVADVKTGLRLEQVGADQSLPPASVAKIVTALYALDTLGAEHRFTTRLLRSGPLENGVLKGDLILAGGSDPTLDTDALAAMAATLKASGLREIRGRFLVWPGALPHVSSIDPGQPDHVGYSPAVGGIALNFNRVHFEWKRGQNGYAVSMDARTERYRPAVRTALMKVVARDLPVYTYDEKGGVDHWTVARSALGKGGARWLPVRNPAAYAGDVFRTLAAAHGVKLPAAEITRKRPAQPVRITGHDSAPLWQIVQAMLKFSNNLTAEMVGLAASARRGQPPTSLAASARTMNAWANGRYGLSGLKLKDHSGLSDASRARTDDLLEILLQEARRGTFRPLLKQIRMRDAKGRPIREHPIKVNAKTGTLNFVSGLAGFMTAPDGTELAFSYLSADTGARRAIKRADREAPSGARGWNRKSKKLQQVLIERWGRLYGS